MQKGIKIDSKGKDSRAFLLEMMDQLEKVGFTSFNSAVNTVLFKDKQVISSLRETVWCKKILKYQSFLIFMSL